LASGAASTTSAERSGSRSSGQRVGTPGSSYLNLAISTALYDGPEAGLRLSRDGIRFSEQPGIAEVALGTAIIGLSLLAESGRPEQALG
jgi:hypothetical protein